MDNIDDLKNKVFSGIIWKGMERILAQVVSLVVSIILARLLLPSDYSVVSIATIFFSFCNLFISSGLNTALIQKVDSDALDYSTVFTTNMFFAFLLYGLMFFAAPVVANLYDKPIVIPVIRIMALSFFINGYKAVLTAKISSDMQFRKFFWSTLGGTVISAFVGIIMAVNGMGVWSLVAQQLTNSVIDSIILTITTKLIFSFRFSFDRFKTLFDFAGKIILASFFSVLYDECKPLIVGIKFTTDDLAYYNKGNSFPNLINSIGNNTLSSALFPAMTKIQDDSKKLLQVMRRFMKISSFFIFPMMFGMVGIAENFVKVVLTEKWLPIVPFITVFSFTYMLDLIQVGNLQAIKALGRSDIVLKTEVIKKSLYAVIILVFVICSNSPVILALSSVLCAIVATIVNTYPNKKLLGYSFTCLLKDLLPNFLPALIMCGIILLMNRLALNMYILILLQIVIGIIVYVGLCFFAKNENLIYLKKNWITLIFKGKK